MSAPRPPRAAAHSDDPPDDIPPPYTLLPTDEVSLEFGPARPFQPPPQQPRQPPRQQPRQPSPELSDFARDFYATGGGSSRSLEAPRRLPSQSSVPDDGRPTRSPVSGHPLLNNGKTLVYPAGYECTKCRNTGYKSFDPSQPCRKCWDKYSKPYAGPIIYASWNDGPSNRQRPLSNLRSSTSTPSLSRSISTIVNQARNDLYSLPANPARRSQPPPSPAVSPSRPPPPPPPCLSRPRSDFTTSAGCGSRSSPNWSRNGPPPPLVLQPGDPRIGGRLCWNCYGSGQTLGFLLLSDRSCHVCNGIGRLL